MTTEFDADIAAVQRIAAVPRILEVVCRSTGMGFAAVARVTDDRWVCCAVRDEIAFGLAPGGELEVETTICHEIRQSGEAVVIDTVEAKFALTEPVNCGSGRIAQLFSNLLGNALTHGSAANPVRVRTQTRDDAFELSLANSGDPIPPAAMERLFQPFYRVAIERSLGLGLGLYIASEIARAHGGTLGVDSSRDETRFTFRMPIN
jgi:signal transduction histidine kinase